MNRFSQSKLQNLLHHWIEREIWSKPPRTNVLWHTRCPVSVHILQLIHKCTTASTTKWKHLLLVLDLSQNSTRFVVVKDSKDPDFVHRLKLAKISVMNSLLSWKCDIATLICIVETSRTVKVLPLGTRTTDRDGVMQSKQGNRWIGGCSPCETQNSGRHIPVGLLEKAFSQILNIRERFSLATRLRGILNVRRELDTMPAEKPTWPLAPHCEKCYRIPRPCEPSQSSVVHYSCGETPSSESTSLATRRLRKFVLLFANSTKYKVWKAKAKPAKGLIGTFEFPTVYSGYRRCFIFEKQALRHDTSKPVNENPREKLPPHL